MVAKLNAPVLFGIEISRIHAAQRASHRTMILPIIWISDRMS
jgi:hypothetical protein